VGIALTCRLAVADSVLSPVTEPKHVGQLVALQLPGEYTANVMSSYTHLSSASRRAICRADVSIVNLAGAGLQETQLFPPLHRTYDLVST
jgi:hypothetical protein